MDTPYFEGCMPIEVMAERGPHDAALRADEAGGADATRATGKAGLGGGAAAAGQCARARSWNMVGFQTKLKHGEQVRVFRTIPGLEKAEFARLGGLHRNSFIQLAGAAGRDTAAEGGPAAAALPGQITGCEGYVESAAVGLMAGLFLAARARGRMWCGRRGRRLVGRCWRTSRGRRWRRAFSR
jgi:methylenetetrahydrofolate--tRNA-(uracil-5-)-methyltransferase